MTQLSVDSQYLQDLLLRFLAFPTPLTPDGESDAQLIAFLRDHLGAEMTELGLGDVAYDEMGNVCGKIPGTDPQGDGLLFVGFGMTHPAATMPDPYQPRVVDGAALGEDGTVVVGRGAGEQKGPLAAAVTAFKSVIDGGVAPRRDLYLLGLASGETGRHDAIRRALEHFQPEVSGCVIAVCSANDIVVAHKGRIDLQVVVKGKAAHSSSPWLGLNALDGARGVLERISSIELGDPDPELGPRSVTATSLETRPKASHTVPGEAELILDWRLLPGDTPEWAKGLLEETVADLEPYEIEVRAADFMYPSEVDPDSGIVKELTAAVESVSGKSPNLVRISGATDTGYVNRQGIPAVLFGPGDIARAHTDDDFILLDEAIESAQALVRLMTS